MHCTNTHFWELSLSFFLVGLLTISPSSPPSQALHDDPSKVKVVSIETTQEISKNELLLMQEHETLCLRSFVRRKQEFLGLQSACSIHWTTRVLMLEAKLCKWALIQSKKDYLLLGLRTIQKPYESISWRLGYLITICLISTDIGTKST